MVKYNQKFSIRKVSVGAASVIIGLTAGNSIVNAAEVEEPSIVASVNTSVSERIDIEKVLERALPVTNNEKVTNKEEDRSVSSLNTEKSGQEEPLRGKSLELAEIREVSEKSVRIDRILDKKREELEYEKNKLIKKIEQGDLYYSYYNDIQNVTSKEELTKLSFDIDKKIFNRELSRDYSSTAHSFVERLEKVFTIEGLEKLREEYKTKQAVNEERKKISRYISRNLNEINSREYDEKLNLVETYSELQKIKEEAKEKNKILLDIRIEREQKNIENIMTYIEPLTDEQREYIRKEMISLYKEKYEEKEGVEEGENLGGPKLDYSRNSVRYAVGNSELERYILNKIYYLYILNSEHPFFTKSDFTDLSENILKAKNVDKFKAIIDKYNSVKALRRLENEEKEILKNGILTAKNREYHSGPGSEDLDTRIEQFVNSLDDNKFLTKEEVEGYRKKIFSNIDYREIEIEVNKRSKKRELDNIFAKLDVEDKKKLTDISKVDVASALDMAKEYEKINFYKNLTSKDKEIFKSRVEYYPENSYYLRPARPHKIYREDSNASLLSLLYTLDIPKEEKGRLRDYIIKGEFLDRQLLSKQDLVEYVDYYKNQERIKNVNFSDESKLYLTDINNTVKHDLDQKLKENYEVALRNDRRIMESKVPSNLSFKIAILEKLFTYSYIPQNKKLSFEKETISTNDNRELYSLSAMHRALNEMLEIQSGNINTPTVDLNEKPSDNKPVKPSDKEIKKTTKPSEELIIPTNIKVISKKLGDRKIEVTYDKTKTEVDNIHLEKVRDNSVEKLIKEKLGTDYNVLEVFEIYFEKDNTEVKSDISRTVSVTLVEKPSGKVEVYHVTNGNNLEFIPSTVIGEKVYFTTNHFSKFMIVEYKNNESISKEEYIDLLAISFEMNPYIRDMRGTTLKKTLPKTSSTKYDIGLIATTLLVSLILINRRKRIE